MVRKGKINSFMDKTKTKNNEIRYNKIGFLQTKIDAKLDR